MSELLEVELPRDRGAARLARQLVAARFGTSLTADELDTVWLLASELVNNAVLHGQGQITMKAQVDGRQVRVSAPPAGRATGGASADFWPRRGLDGRLPPTRASTNEQSDSHDWSRLPCRQTHDQGRQPGLRAAPALLSARDSEVRSREGVWPRAQEPRACVGWSCFGQRGRCRDEPRRGRLGKSPAGLSNDPRGR